MRRGGIFNKPLSGFGGMGVLGGSFGSLGGVVEDQIERCYNNMIDAGYGEAEARKYCEDFTKTAVGCAPKCSAYRQDSPEWANCIQKCHGYPPVNYDAKKSECTAKGMIYSWLEGGCVSKEKYNSCPAGTVYATYEDGTEKCIGIPTDLTTDKCPSGTKLQNVQGGQACVSPVVPGAKTPTPKTPTPIPGTTTGKQPVPESTAGIPILVAVAALALAGGLWYYNNQQKKKKAQAGNVPRLMTRANCRYC